MVLFGASFTAMIKMLGVNIPMPIIKKKSTGRRRRIGFRKRPSTRRYPRGARLTGQLTKNVMVRPDKLRVKLPYTDYYSVACPMGGVGVTRSWNLNSIYDPDRTGIGHQPLGHDEWNNFYSRYRVYGVSYELTMTNLSADNVIAGTINTSSYVPSSSFVDVGTLEQPRSRKLRIGNREGNSTTTMRGYLKLPPIIGQTNEQYRTSDENVALFSSSPVAQACLNLNLLAMNTTSVAAVTVYIRMVYHVELMDPHPIGISVTKPGQEPLLE